MTGTSGPHVLCYDAEWLAVLRATSHLESGIRGRVDLRPAAVAAVSNGRSDFGPTAEEEAEVRQRGGAALEVHLNFELDL